MANVGLDETLLGRTIAGKYAIESFVGNGAMGAVYKARQIALDKTVAVKVLHREVQKDAQFAGRFKREAKAASRLDHPNSLRVLDFGEEPDGLLYMAMEYLDGRDLFAVLRAEFPLSPSRIVNILAQALAALQVAHDLGIIHRDLKPENIMILAGKDDEGRPTDIVKVCDFGIAKIVDSTRGGASVTDASGRLSTRGLIVGTPEYMSPEQGRGEPLDSRADLYSMGVILYQLITGTVPFEAENAIGVVLKHVTEEPRRPSEVYPHADPHLERIALKAMAKPRHERYASAREMRADLRTSVDGVVSNPDVVGPSKDLLPNSARRFQSAATERAMTPILPRGSGPISGAHGTESKPTFTATTIPELDAPLEIPRRRPSLVAIALAPLVLGALGAVAYFSLRHPAETTDGPALASATATASSSTASAFSRASSVPVVASSGRVVASASTRRGPPELLSSTAIAASAGAEGGAPHPANAGAEGGAPAEVIDADHASVSVLATRGDAAASALALAIDVPRATSCYRDGLRTPKARGRPFRQTLKIATDATGLINRAAMPFPDFLPTFQECYVEHLIGRKVDGASSAKAEIDLAFAPR